MSHSIARCVARATLPAVWRICALRLVPIQEQKSRTSQLARDCSVRNAMEVAIGELNTDLRTSLSHQEDRERQRDRGIERTEYSKAS